MDSVDLAIRMTSDASDAVAGLDSVGDAAERMAADVDTSFAKADAAGSRLDSVADSADGMASSSSQAAGGLGDLGGALALMPGPLGAVGAGMEAVAPAIMGVTGAADLLNLVTKSTIVQQTRARIAAIATGVAQRGQAAATYVAAAAQRVLNAAMRANPIGLIITALLIVAGLFVLAYKRSETFRNIVNTVVNAVKGYLTFLITVIRNIPAAFMATLDRIREWASGIKDKVTDAADTVRDALGGAFDWVMDKVQPIIDAVQRLIDLIGNIDFPNLPDLPDFGRVIAGTSSGPTVVNNYYETVTVDATGLLTETAAADVIVRALNTRARRLGRPVVVT